MTQDGRRDDHHHESDDRFRRDQSVGERAFGRDQSTGERHASDPRDGGRPAGGWQDPDRDYSEEARGHHRGQDPWAGGQHRYGYGGEAQGGFGGRNPGSRAGGGGMGGHDPYGQHGLGGQQYEDRHARGPSRQSQGGYGRHAGGEMYSGYGAQDQGWGRGEQGRGEHHRDDQHRGHRDDGGFHPEYQRWRREQISKLDEDYQAWCQERQTKFNDEFEAWRKGRGGPQGQGAITMSNSTGLTGETTPQRDGNEPGATISGSAIAGGGTSQAGGISDRPTEEEQRKS